jgi:hypothetical protein
MCYLTATLLGGDGIYLHYALACSHVTIYPEAKLSGNTGKNTIRLLSRSRGSLPLQTSHVTVIVVLISRNGTRIGVLPESMMTPPVRQSADAASIASDPQRAGRAERSAIPGAGLPPISGGVNHWVAADTGMVGVAEIVDPADHRSRAQAITSGAIRVICGMMMGVQFVNLGN